MLYKSGNDTLVTMPLKQIDNINKQLQDSRKTKSDYSKLYKAWNAQKIAIDTLKLELIASDSLIKVKDSIIFAKDIIIKRNYNDYMKAVYRYERAEKKNKKYKAITGIVGTILVLVNIVVFTLK